MKLAKTGEEYIVFEEVFERSFLMLSSCSARQMVTCRHKVARGSIYGHLQGVHLQMAYS